MSEVTKSAAAAGTSRDHPLWDWPVRLIHWLIALILPASWWTAEEGYMEIHQWLGLSLLIAVLTRLCWGLIGSPQARFRDFLRGPAQVLAYLRGAPLETPGHNPLGGWSAMLLWILLVLQALTGTVGSDDVLFTGPFHYVFDTSLSDRLSELHEVLFNVIVALVALHIAAIAYYERIRRQRLLRPMVFGKADGRSGTGPAQPLYKALIVAVLLAGMLWALIQLAPVPEVGIYW
jgi:cytochrome b